MKHILLVKPVKLWTGTTLNSLKPNIEKMAKHFKKKRAYNSVDK
jgi:hypothetical protein